MVCPPNSRVSTCWAVEPGLAPVTSANATSWPFMADWRRERLAALEYSLATGFLTPVLSASSSSTQITPALKSNVRPSQSTPTNENGTSAPLERTQNAWSVGVVPGT